MHCSSRREEARFSKSEIRNPKSEIDRSVSRRLLRFFSRTLRKLPCPRRPVLLDVSARLRRDAPQKIELELKQGNLP
ncbi:MAG: hypothetical protein DME18_00555 [Verrucomicrobia bacterium]|nr:MAG: hypothetical protein DME18_00555 [Verrucomicrobiota bacterium]